MFRLEVAGRGRFVENLCMNGAKPVEKPTTQNFLWQNRPTIVSGGAVDAVFAPRFA
jgi:hypothetical protein